MKILVWCLFVFNVLMVGLTQFAGVLYILEGYFSCGVVFFLCMVIHALGCYINLYTIRNMKKSELEEESDS